MEDYKKEEMKIEMLCSEMEELFKKTKEVAEKYRELDFSQLTPDDFGTAFDIMKDTAESKMYITKAHKNMAEAKYYCTLVKAMEENADEYGDTWDEDGPKYYRGQPRSKTSGRYMKRGDGRRNNYVDPDEMYMMDMDLYRMDPTDLRRKDKLTGVHYYTNTPEDRMEKTNRDMYEREMKQRYYDGYSDGMREGQSMNTNNSGGSTRLDRARKNYEEKHDMASLEEMMNAIQEEIKKSETMMDSSQKTMAKNKLVNLANSIK